MKQPNRIRVSPVLAALCGATLFVACGGDDDEAIDRRGATGGEAGTAGAAGDGGMAGTATGAGGTAGDGGTAGTTGDGGALDAGGAAGAAGTPTEFDGQEVFRHDTFGNEQFWTDQLRLHEFIEESLDPMTALAVGLKVDADVLPEGILEEVDLEDPATTVALLQLGAVIGVEGQVDASGNLTAVGITCALCHTDVDDSVMEGIGSRLDGYANNDLDPGLIISMAPALADNEEAQEVYTSWGPGFFDPRYNQDGINAPVVIPPIYGLEGVPLETYTGDGPMSYWNSYVGVTQMGGQGSFFDPRIDVESIQSPDLVTPKLPALYAYQITLETPPPPADSFDEEAAGRGETLFDANCASCHAGSNMTDASETLHDAAETGMDPTAAERSATGKYRTTPLRALWQHPPYFHDGSAPTLEDVVTHYDDELSLGLTADEQTDLVQYLLSL